MAITRLTDELMPGMKLEEDIFNKDRVLLLAKGAVLTEETIKIIKRLGYTNVSVQKPPDPDPPGYWNRLDEEKLMEFKKSYQESEEEVVDLIRRIGDSRQVDVEQAFNVTGSLLQEFGSTYNLFPYMSQVKELDHHTSGHSMNVSLICGAICQWLSLDPETIRDIVVAGLLHDIGKSRLRPDVLFKKDLTWKEFEEFQKHTLYGHSILEEADAPETVRLGALLHHEREDGSGYPKGARGGEIPLVAKIIAVADMYDSMTFEQSQAGAACPFKVLERLQSEFLGVLDTRILISFLARTAECYVGEMVRLSDGRTGQIVVVNRMSPSRPMVRTEEGILDLSEKPGISIEAIIPMTVDQDERT